MKEKSLKFSRKKRNAEIIEKMKRGESLKLYDNSASWFPPRPTIPKDPEAIAKLYPKEEDIQTTTEEKE